MKDDFSISGVNDSCEVHNKIDLHMVDTFSAMVKLYFRSCSSLDMDTSLVAKTYDLKSAYRQVPIRASHYKYAYFSVFNHELGTPQIYHLKTIPFGATHSAYCFLRLARLCMLLQVELFTCCAPTSMMITSWRQSPHFALQRDAALRWSSSLQVGFSLMRARRPLPSQTCAKLLACSSTLAVLNRGFCMSAIPRLDVKSWCNRLAWQSKCDA